MKRFIKGIAFGCGCGYDGGFRRRVQRRCIVQIRSGEQRQIIMGTNAEFPPFEYKEGNAVVGVDAELMQKIADKLGLILEIKDMAFESLPEALRRQKYRRYCRRFHPLSPTGKSRWTLPTAITPPDRRCCCGRQSLHLH